MAVYKRGSVFWYEFTYKTVRYRKSTGKRNEGAAEKVERKERARIEAADELGTVPARKAHTLREAADKWFATEIMGNKTAGTVVQRLRILFRHLDQDMRVIDLGPLEIGDAILARRLEPIRQSPKGGEPRLPTNGTVNRDMIDTTLRPIMNFAAETLEEPVRHIKWVKLRLKEPKGRARNFTPAELAAWRGELPEWHRPLFDFLAIYGVRLDEAFFPPAAVNVEAAEVTLYDTKNGTDHALPIHDDDLPAIAQRARQATLAGLPTIWFKDDGGELTPTHWRGFQSASRQALDRAGILNARPAHDLRHHAATTLYRATGNIKLVQDLLNHKNIASSARYAHTNKDDLRRAMKTARTPKDPTKAVVEPKTVVDSTDGRVT